MYFILIKQDAESFQMAKKKVNGLDALVFIKNIFLQFLN